MSRQASIELAMALAALESESRALQRGVRSKDTAEEIRRYRGWQPVDSYHPRDIGTAISNAVRASRRLAGEREK